MTTAPARTIAVLAIRGLTPDPDGFGPATPVEHRGNATLALLDMPFDAERLDDAAFALHMVLNDAIDAHADPRGILMLPDGAWPAGEDYATIAATGSGLWWQPPRFVDDALPVPHGPDAPLMREMEAALGPDRALDLSVALEVALVNEVARPGEGAGCAPAQAAIAAAMGAAFAERLAAAMAARVAEEIARMAPPPMRLD